MRGERSTMRGERSTTITSDSLVAPSQSLLNTIFLNICDLPNCLLIEILCRLPCKFVLRCKCVCKSWSTLISHPYFESRRALYLQDNCDNEQTPMFVERSYRLADRTAGLFTIDSKQTPPELRALDFRPSKLVLVATYNDLILWSETLGFQMKYYICNPYTKQWVALPPTILFPRISVGVGFICDSDYRCRIVRLLKFEAEPAFRLTVEVFSSETGKWIESVVLCPQRFRLSDFMGLPALADDGTLYWLGHGGFLIGLEPFKLDNNDNYHCHFISEPDADFDKPHSDRLGVCRGCVRMCRLYTRPRLTLYVWELKEEDTTREVDGVGRRMMKWCLKESRVDLDPSDSRNLMSYRYWPLALDPNDEEVLYLLQIGPEYDALVIVTCNIRTKTVIDIPRRLPLSDCIIDIRAFTFMLPCWRWPTPIPKLDHHNNSSCPTQEEES